jgi:nucleotide-binding universal stress UspA family protein
VYSRLVLAVDGSERAWRAEQVAAVAAAGFAAPVEAVEIVPDPGATGSSLDPAHPVHRRVADDVVAGLIAEVRATQPPGLLCLAARGRTPAGEALLGSVSAGVVRRLQAPLLLAGPGLGPVAPQWRRVVVGLDGSTVAEQILPTLTAWARQLSLAVTVVHVAYPLADPRETDGRIDEQERQAVASVRSVTDALRGDGVDASASLIDGTSAAAGLLRRAEEVGADLIALATHGRSAVARALTGSVTATVLRRSPLPLLLERPAGLT